MLLYVPTKIPAKRKLILAALRILSVKTYVGNAGFISHIVHIFMYNIIEK